MTYPVPVREERKRRGEREEEEERKGEEEENWERLSPWMNFNSLLLQKKNPTMTPTERTSEESTFLFMYFSFCKCMKFLLFLNFNNLVILL